MVFGAAVYRNAATLGSGEGAHDFVERGFDREDVHVWAWDHDFADLHLAQFDRADDELFFSGGQEAALACLLDLNLQLFGGVRSVVAVGLGDAEGFDDRAGDAVQEVDGPAEGVEEPGKRQGNEQGYAFGAGQADGFGDQLAKDDVQNTQEHECNRQGDRVDEESGGTAGELRPNGLKHRGERAFAQSA